MLFNHPRAEATPATQQEHHPWERQRENTHVAQPWAFKHHSFCCISPCVCMRVRACVRVYLISSGNLPFCHYHRQIAYGSRRRILNERSETVQKCIYVLNYSKIFLFVGSDLHFIKRASLMKSAFVRYGFKKYTCWDVKQFRAVWEVMSRAACHLFSLSLFFNWRHFYIPADFI